MPIKHTDFIIRGMYRDLSEHAFNPEFAYENKNLRITTEPNTSSEHTGDMYALTNEKGNKYIPILGLNSMGHNAEGQYGNMNGIPIGQCLINKQWIVFTKDLPTQIYIPGEEREIEDFAIEETYINDLKTNDIDRIYRLWHNGNELNGELLYEGHLNFDWANPIETLPSYENEQIQKVYWTDGINQPRFINVVENEIKKAKWNDFSFDFVSNLDVLSADIDVEVLDSGGYFPAGKVQYYITYSNLFGVETNIVTCTGLQEIVFNDRAASQEEIVPNSYRLKIKNIDTSFEFVNIYSVIRTSLNNVPNCKRIAKLSINDKKTLEYIDTNTNGEAIEPQSLFYKGGEEISAYTFDSKDNTLFLGNYTIKRPYISNTVRNALRRYATNGQEAGRCYFSSTDSTKFKFDNGVSVIGSKDVRYWMTENDIRQFDYLSKKTNVVDDWALWNDDHTDQYFRGIQKEGSREEEIIDLYSVHSSDKFDSYFRYGNIYRIGLQFQYYTGRWSEVVWLGDYKNNSHVDWLDLVYNYQTDEGVKEYRGYADGITWKIKPLGSLKIDSTIKHVIQNLVDSGYRRVRPVIVYPRQAERYSVLQGFLCNTVFQGNNPLMNYPDWYIRTKYDSVGWEKGSTYLRGAAYHKYKRIIGEIEGVSYAKGDGGEFYDESHIFRDGFKEYSYYEFGMNNFVPFAWDYTKSILDFDKQRVFDTTFYQDESVLCLYSPDVEMDDSIQTMNFSNKKLEIIGGYKINNWRTETEFQTSSIPKIGRRNNNGTAITATPTGILYKGLLVNRSGTGSSGGVGTHYNGGYLYENSANNFIMYEKDGLNIVATKPNSGPNKYLGLWKFPVYIWNSAGSISGDRSAEPSAVLKSNKILNAFNATVNLFYDEPSQRKIIVPNDIQVWHENDAMIKIGTKNNFYKGYVNTTVLPYVDGFGQIPLFADSNSSVSQLTSNVENIDPSWFTDTNENNELLPLSDSSQSNAIYKVSKDCSVSVKYKSVPHLVISMYDKSISDNTFVMTDNAKSYEYTNFLTTWKKYGYNPIVNIIQDVNTDTIFGGWSDNILAINNFIPCGEAVDMCEKYTDSNGSIKYRALDDITIIWSKGDTYYQEYECLKTYPWSLQEENEVTEVLRIPLESYVNVEGRYDKNKHNPNLGSLPSNWNLRNPIYDQQDNFMMYHGLDLSRNSVDNFQNSFTWTLTKWAGDEVDKWTQITLANTMDVDGSKGNITKILRWQDNLLCFQPNGISQILYNEREQIATGSGVPVELSNSGKVNGTRYMTNIMGCNNKWSITSSEKALYWVDDVNKQMIMMLGQPNVISDTCGFHSWINEKANLNVWNPYDFNSFVSYYDPYNENVMFIYDNAALSFNEQLNCYDSFLSYGHTPYYMAFNNTAYMLSNADSFGQQTYKVWEMFKGDYNYFFTNDNCTYNANGTIKERGKLDKNGNPTDFGYEPYFTTILVNPDMPYDKVFNNMDMRTDMWDKTGKLLEETFSHLEVWNEFQWNKSQLVRNVDIPKVHLPAQHSILKKKFRVWYMNIPRDIKQSNPRLRYYNRDRMRNTWLYVKLSKELIQDDPLITYPYISDNKHIIHHIGVSYFV